MWKLDYVEQSVLLLQQLKHDCAQCEIRTEGYWLEGVDYIYTANDYDFILITRQYLFYLLALKLDFVDHSPVLLHKQKEMHLLDILSRAIA